MDGWTRSGDEPGPAQYGRLSVETADLGPAGWLTERHPGHGDFGTVEGRRVLVRGEDHGDPPHA
ncbi:hypothetical protein ACWD5B_34160, partial [Streptomyces tanashiensis]